MISGNCSDNGELETCPAGVLPGSRPPIEPFEYAQPVARQYFGSLTSHPEYHRTAPGGKVHVDRRARRRVLERIIHELSDCSYDEFPVGEHGGFLRRHGELESIPI